MNQQEPERHLVQRTSLQIRAVPSHSPVKPTGQLVMSALLNLAQAIEQKSTM